VEPAETPSARGTASAPDRADVAKHRLAEIWRSQQPDLEIPAVESARASARRRREGLIAGLEQTLADRANVLGCSDPETIGTQLRLARAKLDAGRATDAIALLEKVLGAIDPEEIGASAQRDAANAALAGAYLSTRRASAAVALYELLLGERAAPDGDEAVLGYRIRLAVAHRASGDAGLAIEQLRVLVDELERTRTPADRLLEAIVELGRSHVVAGQALTGAVVYERAQALAHELHGAGERATLEVRLLLARAFQQAGEVARAVDSYRRLFADAELALGTGDRLTSEIAGELAALRSFSVAGRSAQLGE
jgi:tetratricopeptide (TPR) repeat protein